MNVSVLNAIYQGGIIAIVRGIQEKHIVPTVTALYDGGITAVEITLNTPGALDMIKLTKEHFGDKMVVGAGTVLDAITARSAILAGADFVLSPTLDIDVIQMCNTYAKVAVPGVFTPTEALTAWRAGAPIIKIFPASVVGPKYIKDIKGPLNQLNLMPVGGVSLQNAKEFIECGSFAIGIGSEIVNKKRTDAEKFDEITEISRQFVSIVRSVR
ncbi:MAG: bifunctional 4-hydroxy-2-oxoglutarate aldolase/2-dehydro-3-deoxy-phosphogluconate aldolase [Ruminiclostridium sp.]